MNIGLTPSLLTYAETVVTNFDKDGMPLGEDRFNVTSRVTKFDFARSFETGGGVKVLKRCLIYFLLSYQFSFTTITNA